MLTSNLADRLFRHLFPGDGDEHGAIIAAGISRSDRGIRLLGRELYVARDGIDYVPGQYGYRMLRGEFITRHALSCRDEQLCYLAVHNHGGENTVGFSKADFASHERGYPALLDILRGQPVGAIVCARNAVAGDIWLSSTNRLPITETRIIGSSLRWLFPKPPSRPQGRDEMYDRQARLFGDAGQDLLARAKTGIIGAGGVGSLLVEYLARLGVGCIVVADPERLDITNLPRVVRSTRWDTRTWLTDVGRSSWLKTFGRQLATKKVRIAKRVAREANPRCRIDAVYGDITDEAVAKKFIDCDFVFLAADTNQARLVFNALVHQYLIPGFQIGTKVPVEPVTGEIGTIFTVCRPVDPNSGCLWCNGFISSEGLQREAATPGERKAQRYIDEPDIAAPSVITLNATVASQAANDFLFAFTGLTMPQASSDYLRFLPRQRQVWFDHPRKDEECRECGFRSYSRFGRGDSVSPPTR